MKSISSYFKIDIKLPRKMNFSGVVPYPKFIWEASIVFLVVLLVGVLFFDGYVFFGKVQQLQNAVYEPGATGAVKGIDAEQLNQARAILEKRAADLEHSGDNLPEKNPFRQ